MISAIKEKEKIEAFLKILKTENERDYVLAKIMLNTGLRISDVRCRKRKDFEKEYLEIKEKKTGKIKTIKINNEIRRTLQTYVRKNKKKQKDYLFESQKGNTISTVQIWRNMKKAAAMAGIQNFGTHSLRKTWGYHMYMHTEKNIGLVMSLFNHSDEAQTLRYIGITQEQKDEACMSMQL